MRTSGILVILCAWAGIASADSSQEQADRLFNEGRALMLKKPAPTREDATAACEKFEAAIKLDATATGTMLNLGLCYETLGMYATSIRWFRKAQAAAYEGKQAPYEQAAKDHTRVIAPKVPTIVLEIAGAAADVEVRIDGRKIDPSEFNRFEVDPGSHELVARTAGKQRVTNTIVVADGEAKNVAIAFEANAVPVYADRGSFRRKIAFGIGAGGVGMLGFLTWYGFYEKRNYEDRGIDDAKTRLRYFGTSVFVIGTGAVATAIYIYLTAPGKEMVSDGTAFAPVLGRDNVGFAVSGSF